MNLADMTRDQLARHLYVHAHDGQGAPDSWRRAGEEEWDSGDVNAVDRASCYRRADAILAGR